LTPKNIVLLTLLFILLVSFSSFSCGNSDQNVDKMYDRSFALVRMRMVNDALELLEQALEIEPERYDLLRLYWQLRFKRDEGAIYELKGLEIENPDNPLYPRLLNNLLDDPGERMEAGRRALKLQPDYDEIYLSLGDVFEELEMIDSAEVYYSRALKLNPESSNALISMARIRATQGNTLDAAQIYWNIIDQTGSGEDHDKAYEELFFLHWEANDSLRATQIAKSALTRVSDPWINNDFAWVLGEAEIEIALAESLALKAIDEMTIAWMKSEYPEIDEDWAVKTARQYKGYFYDTLGSIYQIAGETDKAISAFETAAELIPFVNYDLLMNLSKVYRETGRTDEAVGSLLDILSVSMNDDAFSMLGEIYTEMYGDTTGIGALVKDKRDATIEPSSDFRMASLTGGMVSLSEFRGNVVLLNFWFPT
jgi:tetratricopeptide (TPR) repeat protein